MALAMVVDTLDSLDDAIKPLYIEKDGKFVLDVDGHDKNDDENRIPKARLDQEIQKRKESDQTLNEIAEQFVDDVLEDMRDLIPDLPAAKKIQWIKAANKKGLFNPQQDQNGPDSKRPGSKRAENFEGMTPTAKMATGYKNK